MITLGTINPQNKKTENDKNRLTGLVISGGEEEEGLLAGEHVSPDSTENNIKQNSDGESLGKRISLYILVALLICIWYMGNAFNGVATKSFANNLDREQFDAMLKLLTETAIFTSQQLLLGLVLAGWYVFYYEDGKFVWGGKLKENLRIFCVLGILHGMGAFTTNVGFFYGKVSMVMVIKMLEPFQTVFFTYVPGFGTPVRLSFKSWIGLILVVTGGILSVWKESTLSPDSRWMVSIGFATISAFSLSARNVLQRRLSFAEESEEKPTKKQVLSRQIMKFAGFSFFGLGFLIMVVIFLWGLSYIAFGSSPVVLPPVGATVLHPVYNLTSIMVLGFVNPIIHSIFNVMKRILTIVVAMLWFQETPSRVGLLGIVLVIAGSTIHKLKFDKILPDSIKRAFSKTPSL